MNALKLQSAAHIDTRRVRAMAGALQVALVRRVRVCGTFMHTICGKRMLQIGLALVGEARITISLSHSGTMEIHVRKKA